MCTEVGSSLCRNYSTGRGSPYMGKTFQMQDMRQWTTLIRGHKGEEVDLWLYDYFCKKENLE